MQPISFIASLAPTAGAIKAHGQGGYRIMLDVPEGAYAEIYKLDRLKCMNLVVTITPEDANAYQAPEAM